MSDVKRPVGRPPKPNARSEMMRVRVTPAAKVAFEEEARKRGLDTADAVREALRKWMVT